MAKFYTGQKVRIVHANEHPEVKGMEAIITGPLGHYPAQSPGPFGFGLAYAYPIHVFGIDEEYLASEDELEPILPEGLESPEAIEELYEPDREGVSFSYNDLVVTIKATNARGL